MRFARFAGVMLLTLPVGARGQDSAAARDVRGVSIAARGVPTDARISRALAGLRPAVAVRGEPPLRWTIQQRMKELHVPGVSIAIIDSGRVLWAGGFGLLGAGRSDTVTTTTLFQAQSISKAIAATTMLALVDAGTLALDTDVNAYLTSWKVPSNRFTDSARVTLRRVVSHTAGLTTPSFPGYARGTTLPTLVQILDGAPPTNTPAVRVDTFPGAIERYSGGGLMVLQQLLVDRTGKPFSALAKRLVFDKTAMTSSTFEQPLPNALAANAASGHDLDGTVIPNGWRVFPEQAAAGLWSTATDLARWAIDIAAAWNGATGRILSPATARAMLTTQKGDAGLGVFLEGKDASFAFGHSGSAPGYRADVVMFPALGKGAVVMTNANQGSQLTSELMRSLAAELGWPGRLQKERVAVPIVPADVAGVIGSYDAPPFPNGTRPVITISADSGKLYFAFPPFNPKTELRAEGRDAYFTLSGIGVVFTRDSLGRAQSVMLAGQVRGTRRP